MSALTIPTEIGTRVSINSAERVIARAKGEHGYYGLREQQQHAENMIAFVVLRGSSLADARGYALEVALIRDAAPTIAELQATREARAEYERSVAA